MEGLSCCIAPGKQANIRFGPVVRSTSRSDFKIMNKYPRLKEMGILHPKQIKKYSINSIANYDVLRIIYERGKDSSLPSSRTYKFLRVQKTAVVNKKTGQTEDVLETNPGLIATLDELHELLKSKHKEENLAELIIEELQALEEEVSMRSETIRALVKRL